VLATVIQGLAELGPGAAVPSGLDPEASMASNDSILSSIDSAIRPLAVDVRVIRSW
jgi:hypothetical protein